VGVKKAIARGPEVGENILMINKIILGHTLDILKKYVESQGK